MAQQFFKNIMDSRRMWAVMVLLAAHCATFAQSPTCNITQVDAAMSGQGFQLLNVQGQPCSRYYYNASSTINWNTAANQAAAVGATLVTISGQMENDAVWQAAVQAGISGGVWIGYTDRITEGTWLWEDGSTGSFTNWNSGEPSNNTDICSSTGEDAAVMQMNNGRWNDVYLNPVFPCLFPPSYTSIIKVNLCPVVTVNDAAICGSQPAALTASAMLGSPAYLYSWSSGQTGAAITVTPSATTNFTVTAIDRYGCTAIDTATVTVAVVAAPAITIAADSVCEKSSVQVTYAGSASQTALYTWDFDSAAVITGSNAGPYQIAWTSAGTKNLTLNINENGCTSAQGVASIIVSPGFIADAGRDTIVCQGTPLQLSAVPVGGYTYQWSPAVGLSSPSVANPVFSGAFGNVACTVVVSNGVCSDTDVVNINTIPWQSIALDSSGPLTFCGGGSVTLSTGANYSNYFWSSGDITPTLTVNYSGNFSLEAVDTTGCVYLSDTVTVNTSVSSVVLAVDSQRNVSCHGMTDGYLAISANGGTPGYSYIWNTTHNAPVLPSLAAGTYTVTVTDGDACSATTQFSISAPPPISMSLDSVLHPACFGMMGSIYISASGGTAPYTYSLDNTVFQSNGTFNNLTPASYSVYVRDAAGCSYDSALVTLTVSAALQATYSINHLVSGSTLGAIKVNPAGGTPPYEYALNGGPYQQGSSFTDLAAGTYHIVIRDANGCLFTDTVTVEETTGLSVAQVNMFNVYPNPAGDFIKVDFMQRPGDAALLLYDVHGAVLVEQNFVASELQQGVTLNISALPVGIYFLYVRSADGVGVRKVAVQ